jgi:hypothetical protein
MAERRVARSITLHIGTEKTGTTAIQHCFASHRDALKAAGILYPVSPGRGNHVGLTYFAAGEGDRPPSPHLIGITRAEAPEYRAKFMDRLREEIAASGCGTVFFSSEHLSSRLRSAASTARLIDALRELADEVKVLIYLRPQYELLPSSYSTTIKSGGTNVIRGPKTVKQHFYNYEKMLEIWEKSAGRTNMIVRRFGRGYLKDGSLIADFFDAAGMAVPEGVEADRVLNPALDAYTVEFLRLANPFLPPAPVDGGERERLPFIKALEGMSDRGTPIIPADILHEMDMTFRDGNQAVAERYFPDLGGVLFPPFTESAGQTVPVLTVEKAVEIAVKLWQVKADELRKIRAKAKLHRPGAVGQGRNRQDALAEPLERDDFG